MPLHLRLLAAAHAAVLLGAGAVLASAPTAVPVPAVAAATPVAVDDLAPRRALPRTVVATAPVETAVAVSVTETAPVVRRAAAPARTAAAPRLGVQERGAAALAALDYPWQRLGYAVEFRPHDGTVAGLADPRTRTITVYVRPDHDELQLRATIAHELGHALDFGFGTDERRRRYRELRGLAGGTSWFPCDRCEDYASPAGDWAEVFAAALVGNGDFRSRMAGPPSPEQVAQLRSLFEVPAAPPAQRASEQPPAPQEPRDDEGDDEDEDDRGLLPL